MSFTLTYSLKVSVINLGRTFSAESFGNDCTKTGGSESLGPPAGGMMLAQEPIMSQLASRGITSKKTHPAPAGKIFFMLHKGSSKKIVRAGCLKQSIRLYVWVVWC